MSLDYFAGAATLIPLREPAAITASGHTPGVNIIDYSGAFCLLLSAANTAGTDPTLAVKVQTATSANLIGTVTYSGTGTGKLTEIAGGADSVAETITVTFSSATAFAVSGSVTGDIGTGSIGTRFISPQISFLAFAGATAFVNHDAFTVPVLARTYTDVTGGAFAQVTTAASLQRLKIESDGLGCYLRAALTIDGTDDPAYTASVALLALKQANP